MALSLQGALATAALSQRHVAPSSARRTRARRTAVVEEAGKTARISGAENATKENYLFSIAPAPLMYLAAAEGLTDALEPTAAFFRSLNLPDWLVHWGHPGNMAVVLFAMGGYGSYLGWQLRLAADPDVVLKAKDLHPKLMGGMFFFFALGASGGLLALIMANKPILESPHALTGFTGLGLLGIQAALTSKFKDDSGLRSVHAYLGSAIMVLFLVHAALGLKLGLSF